jgi:hypothetical protein
MVQRVEVQAEFCKYHGIKLNMDKSTYTVVKAKEEASPIEVEGKACKMGRPNGYFKYLGVNMSPTGKIKHEVGRLDSKVMEIYDTLDRKNLTPMEVRYVINTVVVGILQYSMQVVGLPRAFLRKVDARSVRVMKVKCGIGMNSPVEQVFSGVKEMGMEITNMEDLQDAIAVTEMVVRLNSEGMAGEVARARLKGVKHRQGILSCPLDKEGLEESGVKRYGGHTFEYLQKVLLERDMEIKTKDKSMHERLENSKHLAQAFRDMEEQDWGMVKMRFENKYMINDWIETGEGGGKIKSFERLVGEGFLKGKTPTQAYCMVRYLLADGKEEEILKGNIQGRYLVNLEEDERHMETIEEGI